MIQIDLKYGRFEMNWRLIISILALFVLIGCGSGSTKTGPKITAFEQTQTAPGQKASSATPEYQDVGPLELQAAVMAFADTSNSRLSEVATIIEAIGTPQARLTAARMMVFDISSNVEIAAGPYPGIALLDMIVVTSLRRMVWEDFWVPHFGEEARPALNHFKEAEEDIWKAASKVLTVEQLDEFAKIILDWRKKHPKQVAVNYIRFSDFGDLGLKPSMRKLTVPGGLFSSVKEATLVAQDMKVAIDRAFYLMSRMQLVISFQIKLAYLDMIFQPEANGIVDQTKRITGITERYAEIAENLPKELGAETTMLMNNLFANLEKNRNDTIADVFAGLTTWQNATITGVMASVSAEREAAINQIIEALTLQQNELYSRADQMVDRSGNEFEATLNHAFMLGILFIVFFFIMLTLYKVFIARPIDRRE